MRGHGRQSRGSRERRTVLLLARRLTLVVLCAVLLAFSAMLAWGGTTVSAAPRVIQRGQEGGSRLQGSATTASATASTSTTTATATDTPTATATATNTPTPTATDTPTATNTPSPTATKTPAPTPNPAHPWVLDVSQALSQAQWPQQNGNWCGIATIAAISAYLGGTGSQGYITNLLNLTQAVSEWGYPPRPGPGFNPPYLGPYLGADISGDFGTDPRSIAEGLTLTTGLQYHMIVDTANAWDATKNIVDEMLNSQQPIAVIVDHGQHSVLVAGVDTAGNVDPRTNPNSIQYLYIYDPGAAVNAGVQTTQFAKVPLSLWLSGHLADGYNSSYMADPYNSNAYGGKEYDPDPAVGPYTFVHSRYNHLWIGHWVWDAPIGAGANADWAFTPYGALIAGMDANGGKVVPNGYQGASVAMPTNAPPPQPPVKVIHAAAPPPLPPPPPATPTPKPTATATPKPTITPAPTPTLFATPAPVATHADALASHA